MSATPPDQQTAELRLVMLWVWLILMILTSALAAFFWYTAPLAMGFTDFRVGRSEAQMNRLGWLVSLSWFAGLPMLAVAQIATLVIAMRRPGIAALLSTCVLTSFVLMIWSVFTMF